MKRTGFDKSLTWEENLTKNGIVDSQGFADDRISKLEAWQIMEKGYVNGLDKRAEREYEEYMNRQLDTLTDKEKANQMVEDVCYKLDCIIENLKNWQNRLEGTDELPF